MKELLIFLLLISFAVNKKIKCRPNEVLDKQTKKCEKVCEEGKVFNSDTLSREINSANATFPEGQILNNQTSSYEDKKVDTTKQDDDGNKKGGDGTKQVGDDIQGGDGTMLGRDGITLDDTKQDSDDPHELVFDIKSKETKKVLRKLEDENQKIFITVNGKNKSDVNYLNNNFFNAHKPIGVYLNNKDNYNYKDSNTIKLDRDGENKIEVVWNNKLNSFLDMFEYCYSIVSVDLSHLDTSSVTSMSYMFYECFGLKSLNLLNFNTKHVLSMSNTFYSCESLESLNIKHFNTLNVRNMENLFYGCSSLKSLDLSNFDTSSVTTMKNMLRYCTS